MREIEDNLEFIKIENCSVKDNVERTRGQAADWEKILARDISHKRLLPKYMKNSNSTIRRLSAELKNGPKLLRNTWLR